MIKIEGFNRALEEIQKERNVDKKVLIDAVSAALLSASKKKLEHGENLEASMAEDGTFMVFAKKTVVMKVKDGLLEISKKEAVKIKKDAKVGDEVKIDVTPSGFGRLAAQTAKQVIIQRIREAEKEGAYEEYIKKQGELLGGIVQRKETNGYLINLGKVETLLPFSESIPGENYRPKDRIKVLVLETKKTPRGPVISISRAHPNFLKKLFELEIPEVLQGTIEIKGIVREPGRRAKVAVVSKDKNVGAVGTCIGHMGARIQNIVREVGNERIDVIEWSDDIKTFITNAIAPAKVTKIDLNAAENIAHVILPDNQLSLAIGKEGQNVRLAAKLTGWKIDIVSEEAQKKAKEEKKTKEELEELKVKEVNEGKKVEEVIEAKEEKKAKKQKKAKAVTEVQEEQKIEEITEEKVEEAKEEKEVKEEEVKEPEKAEEAEATEEEPAPSEAPSETKGEVEGDVEKEG
jgi:N utilization substance protein A